MTRLKRFSSITELKSNADFISKTKQLSQSEELRLKDFLNLLRSSLLPNDKDEKETKSNNIKNG